MKNLKIRVNSEAESKEAQELLEKLGFKKSVWGVYLDYFIFANSSYYSRDYISNFSECDYREITIQQLKDLVVLKRNDVRDANYKTNYGTQCCITGEDVYAFQDNKWFLSAMQHKDILDMIKPIEKPMKEYLRKNSNGTYSYIGTVQPENISPNVMEIPEGTNIITKLSNSDVGDIYFHWKDFNSDEFWLKNKKVWSNNFGESLNDYIKENNAVIIYQRQTHPEELPFVDDEPINRMKAQEESISIPKSELEKFGLLNDQYAEIEAVRQSHRTASEDADLTIKETLKTRQDQYGSFEDVAMITEQMVDIMRKGYYENLAYNQKMALYMICSKMARIVNGDPNHKDSWHDIAGYATLIDNELESEKDMPF